MNALILAVGKLREKWQAQGCEEYLKRLTRYGKYELVDVPDEAEPDKPSRVLEEKAMEKEGKALLRFIRPQDYVTALCVDGKALSSEQLALWVQDKENRSIHPVLVIGGSMGLSREVLARADERLSFSAMTFPHGLMRVILLEQIYRAERINHGERYHK